MVLKPTELKQKAEEIHNEGISQLERELEEDIDGVLLRHIDEIYDVLVNGNEFCFQYILDRFYRSRGIDYSGNSRKRSLAATQNQMDAIVERTIQKYKQVGWGVTFYGIENRLGKHLGFSVSKSSAQGGI
ncbi:MAG: hypothetical protein V1734_00995 [Nanoarchaeota archaeon]